MITKRKHIKHKRPQTLKIVYVKQHDDLTVDDLTVKLTWKEHSPCSGSIVHTEHRCHTCFSRWCKSSNVASTANYTVKITRCSWRWATQCCSRWMCCLGLRRMFFLLKTKYWAWRYCHEWNRM